VIVEPRALLEENDAHPIAHEGREGSRHGAAAGARADDDDIGVELVHRRTAHPRDVAR
jgi:hypothetical protein